MDATNNMSLNLEPAVTSLLKMYEKLAYRKYEMQCAITKLTSENLAPIFALLGTNDRKRVRLTCKSFKEAIDQFVGIHVNLDQAQIDIWERWYTVTLPPPAASSIRLSSVVTPKYIDHLLKKCEVVREIQFAGQISLSSVTKILTRCKNLRKLSFTDRSHMYACIMPVRLNQLHTLDIGCPGCSSDYVGDDAVASTLWMTYEMILKKLSAPNLRIFRIYFNCVEECSILHRAIAQIFRFLAAHELVEEFCITLQHRYERFAFFENDINYQRFRLDIPKKILRGIQLKRIQVETMEPAFKIWDSILPAQRTTTHMDIMNRSRRWFYYSKLVYNNYSTLKEIRLHNISPKNTRTTTLDMSIFENCKVLECLFLSRFENSTQAIVYCYPTEKNEDPFLDTETSSTPELENVDKLPESLKRLHLQGLVASTEDLIRCFRRLTKLTLLELQLLGYHNPEDKEKTAGDNLGVNCDTIREIFNSCRALDTLFIEEFENKWTKVRNTELGDKILSINLVTGEGYSSDGEYYGILICQNIPRNNGKLSRVERMHLWTVRLSQYYHTARKRRRALLRNKNWGKNNSSEDLNKEKEERVEVEEEVNQIVSETSLLEILDKENGQLEKIHKMMNAMNESQSQSPIMTQSQMIVEETREYAKRYSGTLYSAIPNYIKASRLLKETCDE